MYKHFFKRVIDFTFSLIALLLIWPVLAVVALWLRFANKGAGAFTSKRGLDFMARHKRYIKSNLGKKAAFDKFKKLLSAMEFNNLEQASSIIDWAKMPIINL